MQINKAYEVISNNVCDKDEVREALKEFKSVVSLLTPKDVVCITEEIGDRNAFGGTGYYQYGVVLCPNCDDYLDTRNHADFCPTCGQALVWPKEEYGED